MCCFINGIFFFLTFYLSTFQQLYFPSFTWVKEYNYSFTFITVFFLHKYPYFHWSTEHEYFCHVLLRMCSGHLVETSFSIFITHTNRWTLGLGGLVGQPAVRLISSGWELVKTVAPKCDKPPINHWSGGKSSTAVLSNEKKKKHKVTTTPVGATLTVGMRSCIEHLGSYATLETWSHLSSSLETVGTTKVAADLNESVRLTLMGSNIGSACFQHPPLQNMELKE